MGIKSWLRKRVRPRNGPAGTSLQHIPEVPENDGNRISSSGRTPVGAAGEERVMTVQESPSHHHGHTFHTTNVNAAHGSGPAYFIGHVENANFDPNADLLALNGLLPPHPSISNLRNEYLPGSRSQDERVVWDWIGSPVGAPILWIHGAAGLGKSTLAQHVQQQLRSQGMLAAAIFLSAFRPNLPSPEVVIQLIAAELGRIHNKAIPSVLEAHRQCHGTPPRTLVERLVLGAVRSLQLQHPLVVVLDAADEWPLHGAFMEALSCLLDPSLLRFIVLGRLEPRGKPFQNLSVNVHPLLQVSHEVIQDYLIWRLDSADWGSQTKPSSYDITKLAEKADGLFIWAQTACSLLEDKLSPSSPRDTLEAILQSRRSLGEGDDDLARLYYSAFLLLFPKPDEQNTARMFLGAVMVLQEPLPIPAFSSIVGLREPVVRELQARVKSLQIRRPSDTDTTVHPAGSTFHLSFIEFFQATSAKQDPNPTILTSDSHTTFARACIKEVARIPSTIQDISSILHDPLRLYVVKYLALHISNGAPEVEPGSASEWEASQLCSLLQGLPVVAFQRWGTLLLQLVKPGSGLGAKPYADGEKGLLVLDVGSSLPFGANSQLFQIPCLRVAVLLLPNDERAWSSLGDAYSDLARNAAISAASQGAVAARQNALSAVDRTGDNRGPFLHALATSLAGHFECFGGMETLEGAVELYREALMLHPQGYANRSSTLNDLATCLESQYTAGGPTSNLREAAELHREALLLCPQGHPHRSRSLNNLANCLKSQYEAGGSAGNLREATELHREALLLHPPGHPNRSSTLNNLANCLQSKYGAEGSASNLREATELYREALLLCPTGHPNRSSTLNNLANCLQSKYEAEGSASNLREATELYREALLLCPQGHPHRSSTLNNLANCLQSKYEAEGSASNLREVTELYSEALLLCPQGHPHRAKSLNNLANCLKSQYQAEGSASNLREATELHREALLLHPQGHPNRSSTLNNLANCLKLQYQAEGSASNLREATELHREALLLCPQGHPDRSKSLNNLGVCLQSQYEAGGSTGNLREATELFREALLLCPQGRPDRLKSLNNLANCLQFQYQAEGSASNLREATELHREALLLCPQRHPHRSGSLNNLANCLQLQYQAEGSASHLKEATELHREALLLCPQGHPDRSGSLNNLANCLQSQYEAGGSTGNLREATELHREALSLWPQGHPDRSLSLNNLANCLQYQYKAGGSDSTLREVITLYREALATCPPGHPRHPGVTRNLANALRLTGTLEDMSEADGLQNTR